MNGFEIDIMIDTIQDGSILQMLFDEAAYCNEKKLAILNSINDTHTTATNANETKKGK
jgi:hypothetical protein